jgi:RNA polymerase sigma factor (sigma-70 family)
MPNGADSRGPDGPLAAEPSDEDAVVSRHTLVNALRALPRRQREIVVMRYLGGLSEDEVGSCLGLSVNTVRTHRVCALTRLRKRLGPDWSEEVHLAAP